MRDYRWKDELDRTIRVIGITGLSAMIVFAIMMLIKLVFG